MARIKTTVVISDELKAALERTARERGVSQAEVVRQAVRNWLRADKLAREGFAADQHADGGVSHVDKA